uniref:Uncharacterized protein n=1 Tax=Arundo donax TaxID=35708 RepID=A0A0A8XW39_ARUDO
MVWGISYIILISSSTLKNTNFVSFVSFYTLVLYII